jgi:enoyl-CoA hydratase/carnithine racemase
VHRKGLAALTEDEQRTTSEGDGIRLERAGELAILWLARPRRRNAVDGQAAEALRCAVAHLTRQPPALLAVRGEAGQFSAGGDLTFLQGLSTADVVAFMERMADTLLGLSALPCPVVAYGEGRVVGGGWELLLAADIVFLHPAATLSPVQAELGLIPGWGGGRRLKERIGGGRALALLMAARSLTAEEAVRLGLADGLFDEAGWTAWLEMARRRGADVLHGLKAALRGPDPARFARLWDGPVRRRATERFSPGGAS